VAKDVVETPSDDPLEFKGRVSTTIEENRTAHGRKTYQI
jgi:hypothetical protein